ncbi:peptidase [Allosaccharopolyspora coralli]|uniref:Peptidase n=1 Tax=Allosaccharopolyspora coralli TaxID=2665642 RepID=A0A5Q3QJ42_9PSEU|nr:LON peptidase substrate-binding domain-containing protein [Allosaccharopolyspora coralli]QGK70867.1 peptidase [Allosaccharopolyspora coralli]
MTDTIPLFPLGTVLLPGGALPLHVFEPRYRQLTLDLLHEVVPERRFGIIAIRQGWEVGEGNVDALHDVGCSAVLETAQRLPEDRYDITTTGEHRFRLLQLDTEAAPYLMARVEWLPDTTPEHPATELTERLVSSAMTAHTRYHDSGLRHDHRQELDDDPDPAQLAYTLADDCVLGVDDRQELLAETDPHLRLRLVRQLMLREAEFLRELRAVPASLAEFVQQPGVN